MPGKNFYNYCTQTEDSAINALLEFLNNKEKILKANAGKEDWGALFVYANQLIQAVNGKDTEEIMRAKKFLRFLEPEILQAVIANNTDSVYLNEAYRQIILLYFVIVESTSLEVYDPQDFMIIGLDQWPDYDGHVLLGTLGKILNGDLFDKDYLLAMKAFLPADPMIFKREMTWEMALTMSLVLYILWDYFLVLPDDFKELLVERFFYVSIAVGVPAFDTLSEFLESVEQNDEWRQRLQSILKVNKELVPVSVVGEDGVVLLTNIVGRYYAGLNGEEPAGFTHEEFLKGYYDGQMGRDIYRDWLRQATKAYLFL